MVRVGIRRGNGPGTVNGPPASFARSRTKVPTSPASCDARAGNWTGLRFPPEAGDLAERLRAAVGEALPPVPPGPGVSR